MPSDSAPDNGGWRHPWTWFLTRGLGFFALGFALAWVGSWLNAPWLGWLGFGLGIVGMWMHAIAWGEARRGRGAAWWRWYRSRYERNVRAAEHQATSESAAPQQPDDR